MKPLQGKVAVVAGATRGAGRGIACMLGEAGATVYCTGRSVRGSPATGNRPETIEETAEMVTARGGMGIHVRVDHTVEDQVRRLFEQVKEEQGRLDILVNDVWGGDELTEWGRPFWEHSLPNGLLMQERAVWSHIITSWHGVPLMVEHGRGLIIEVTDGDSLDYRGNLFYDLAKVSAIRLAYAMSKELSKFNITALALTPGYLRSEAILDHFGVTEANWRDAVEKDPYFATSETPFYIGRAVVALACDPELATKSGKILATWGLAPEYGFTDVDGRQPHWVQGFKDIAHTLFDAYAGKAGFVYDDAWRHQDKSWDAYAGPMLGGQSRLVLLRNHDNLQTVLLHDDGSKPTEVWAGRLETREQFDGLIDLLDNYIAQCKPE